MDAEPMPLPAAAAPSAGAPAARRGPPNLTLWVAIVIPLIAVVASIALVFSAVDRAEAELPANYSWEGAALDRDLARAQRAQALGAAIGLEFAGDGRMAATLAFRAPGADSSATALPSRLTVRLTHSTLPALDQHAELLREPGSARYVAALAPLQRGHWLIEVADGDHDAWRLRGRFLAPAGAVGLGL